MFLVRFLRRMLYGLFAIVGALVVIGIVAVLIAWRFFPQVDHPIPDQAVLTLDLGDGVVERSPVGALGWTSYGRAITLRDLTLGLEAAGRDERIKGLVARLGAGELGMARAQEIRDAVHAFRANGKFAIAFAESFGEAGSGNLHYYLATAFDQIWLQPSGDVGLTGFMLESPFLKDLLDRVGVTARIDQREEYKGAMDPFTRSSMPAPVRTNLQQLADAWAQQLAQAIADARGLNVTAARTLIDRGPFMADEAKREKLIDRLAYWDEVEAELDLRAGEEIEQLPVADYVSGMAPPASSAPRIAIVYGLGPVNLASRDDDPLFGDVTMSSATVSQALREAIDDADIRAIIFRIDSPGGSYVASDSIWREVKRARDAGKPVIVSMGDVAASGGYFVAAPAHKIVAQPGTITGSIGVVSGKFVLSDLWDRLDVNWDGVQVGAHADINSPNRDYSPSGWSRLQAGLDRVYADFTGKVAEGRGMTIERVRDVAKGQVWSGSDARENGLVDELGGYGAALRLARLAAGLDAAAEVRLVEFPPPEDGLRALLRRALAGNLLDASAASEAAMLARLAEMLAPMMKLLARLAEAPAEHNLQLPAIEARD